MAPAWHAPGRPLRPRHQRRRGSLRARAPEQHSGTPSRGTFSRARPCVSERWKDAHSDCARGLVRLWLRHGTLLVAHRDLSTSGVVVSFVLSRLSNTLVRHHEPPPRSPDLSKASTRVRRNVAAIRNLECVWDARAVRGYGAQRERAWCPHSHRIAYTLDPIRPALGLVRYR